MYASPAGLTGAPRQVTQVQAVARSTGHPWEPEAERPQMAPAGSLLPPGPGSSTVAIGVAEPVVELLFGPP